MSENYLQDLFINDVKGLLNFGSSSGESGGSSGGSGGDNFPIGDGNTHIWITLAEGRTSPMLGVILKGTVTVDWGDGSEPDTLTGSGSGVVYTSNHEYGKPGDYVITLTAGENSIIGFYGSSYGSYLLSYDGDDDGANTAYRAAVRKIECGKAVQRYSSQPFNYLYALTDIVLNDVLDNGVISGFKGCTSLQRIMLPNTTTILSSDTFSDCYGLTGMVIPQGITKMNYRVFQKCSGAKFYDFTRHASVPAMSATNAFTGIPSDCEIRVPKALADEWKAATNWSTYASNIVGV